MFERFTARARKVVVRAQDEARRLRHDYIGTEHMLLGLLREDGGVAAQALSASGVTLNGVREQVEGIIGYGDAEDLSQAPFTPSAKAALELALKEALRIGHDHIGTEHMLLGLLRGNDRLIGRIFDNLDVDSDEVRQEVVARIEGTGRSRRPSDPLEATREVLRRSFGRPPLGEGDPTYERFTERARKVVVLAQDEARRFHHNYIGTEHLLLGLIREREGVGAHALVALGVDIDEARERVESIVGYGEKEVPTRAPLTPRCKKVLHLGEREALQLGDDYVSSEHILLGLMREGEGVAARILSDLDVNSDEVRREVMRRISDREPEVDPFDEVGRVIEGEEDSRILFQGRVTGIRTELSLPRPLPVSVEAEYSYRVLPGEVATAVEPAGVAGLIHAELEATEARRLEAAITMLGERLLDVFPAMLEATVTISGVPEPTDPPDPTFSVSATFER